MFAGLASPSHLIIVLAVVLLLFGAKRIPELAKGLGTGVKELREGISSGGDANAGAPESGKVRGEASPGSGDETVQAVRARTPEGPLSPVFGVGAPEMVVIGLLLLVVFGPGKLPGMARDLGRFVSEARHSIEEFKKDLVSEGEGGGEPRKGGGPEEGRELEGSVRPEEDEAVASSAQRPD